MRKVTNIVALLVATLSFSAVAYAASGEHAFTGAHNIAATAMNPKTCRFLHAEVDPAVGPTWRELRTYSLYEDARHDAKMSCLNNLVQTLEKKVTQKATLAYKRIIDESTAKTATATCPAGYVVTGGGSPAEVEGSFSATPSSWTVTRDKMSPATMVVEAICLKVAG